MTHPDFSISIIAFNRIDCSVRCIDSILKGGGNFELILTNNGSTDGTLEYFLDLQRRLAKEIPITVVNNETNKYFIEPHNHALTLAQADLFVVLNNDTIVPKSWLTVLRAPFDVDPMVALSGPDGACCSLLRNFYGWRGPRFEYLEGSCLMCRTAVMRKIGLFADYLKGGYGEDSDLSLRVREAGYAIARMPITIKHEGRATSNSVPAMSQFEKINHGVLLRKWDHYLRVRRFDYPVVLKRKSALGDVLLTTPIVRKIREIKPRSPVLIETMCPEVIQMNDSMVRAARYIQPQPAQLTISLDMSYENVSEVPYVQAYADTAGVKLTDDERTPIFVPSEKARAWASQFWPGTKPLVLLHTDPTGWPGRDWAQDRWVRVIDRLRIRGFMCVRIGSGPTSELKTSVDQLGALLERAAFFIGHDSFPIHLACAVGTPVVGVFGMTLPQCVLPPSAISESAVGDINKAPCVGSRHRMTGKTFVQCSDACISSVPVEHVMTAINRLLERKPVESRMLAKAVAV